ncbi:MAG: hypothetical protein GKS05_04755 [Nitrospirales bacterium]|nr:hypothetical protein [Nitrospirales bacterium]
MKPIDDDRSSLPSSGVLVSIADEQRGRLVMIDGVWRLASAIVIGSVLIASAITFLQAAVLIVAVLTGTRLVELEFQACLTRMEAARRALMIQKEGDPNRNVQSLIDFLNSPDMVPSISRHQDWGYWIWAAITILVILAKVFG